MIGIAAKSNRTRLKLHPAILVGLESSHLLRAEFPSPVGPLTGVADDEGLRWLTFENVASTLPAAAPGEHPILATLGRELADYFAGRSRHFGVTLSPAVGTEFQRRAWDYLRQIPFGETRTYGRQAAALGSPAASRAVGRANGANPICIVVPCHRVTGASGSLTGFAGGVERKRWLLDHEWRCRGLFPAV